MADIDVRVEYGLGESGSDVPPPERWSDAYTGVTGSVLIRLREGGREETVHFVGGRERLDEGFMDLGGELERALSGAPAPARVVAPSGRSGLLRLRIEGERVAEVCARRFAEELFRAARRLVSDAGPALGPLGRHALERFHRRMADLERGVRRRLPGEGHAESAS